MTGWTLLDEFVPKPLSGYDPTSVDLWCMKYGFIFPNLFSMQIKYAETDYRRIEIDYTLQGINDYRYTAIRIYCRPEDVGHLKKVYGLNGTPV